MIFHYKHKASEGILIFKMLFYMNLTVAIVEFVRPAIAQWLSLLACNLSLVLRLQIGRYITSPGGVLRYISDREVRSPFLGLKLAILDFF